MGGRKKEAVSEVVPGRAAEEPCAAMLSYSHGQAQQAVPRRRSLPGRFANLDLRFFVNPIVRHEDHAHAPAGMGEQKAAEFSQGQFTVVDDDRHFTVGTAGTDFAAHDVAP